MARQIVQLHDGTIEAFSEGRGAGSRFVVELPVVVSRTAPEASEAEGASRRPARGPRVLAVEDNPDVSEALERILERLGAEVEVVHTAEEGLEATVEHAPDLILLDIGLPDMDGYELAHRLRETEAGRRAELVALTGFGGASSAARAEEAGFDTFLAKPARIDQLRDLLESVEERAGHPQSED